MIIDGITGIWRVSIIFEYQWVSGVSERLRGVSEWPSERTSERVLGERVGGQAGVRSSGGAWVSEWVGWLLGTWVGEWVSLIHCLFIYLSIYTEPITSGGVYMAKFRILSLCHIVFLYMSVCVTNRVSKGVCFPGSCWNRQGYWTDTAVSAFKVAYLNCNWSFSEFPESFVFWKFYSQLTFQCPYPIWNGYAL